MPYIEKSVDISCQPIQAYSIAKNMEDFPNFMPDVQSVKVVSRLDNGTITEWVTEIDGTEIIWTEEDHFDDQAMVITYRLTDGDLDKFEGQWQFQPTEQGTRVTLTVDFDFGIPELVHLIGYLLVIKVAENTEMMLGGLKKAIEK